MKKNGMSLIVLVITIIVMIIMAGAVIITLADKEILGEADDSKLTAQLDSVQQVVSDAASKIMLETNEEVMPDDPILQDKFVRINTSGYYKVILKNIGLENIKVDGVYIIDDNYIVTYVKIDGTTIPLESLVPSEIINAVL
ncbi:MAG: hypothetical protein RR922_03605 [Clostridia bacterium]